MPKFLRMALVGAVLAAVFALAHPAFAEEPSLPFGRYEGSAVGGDADAIAVTLYINGTQPSDTTFSIKTDVLPAVIAIQPSELTWMEDEGGYWYWAASVKTLGLSGSGTGQLVLENGKAAIYGSGDGSFQNKSGSGYGSADMVEAGQTSPGMQVVDAFNGFIGGPPKAGSVKEPRKFRPSPDDPKEQEEKNIRRESRKLMKSLFGDIPLGPYEFFVFILVVFIIMLGLGLL